MRMRSWLFVPGDSDRKIERGFDSGADIVIFDLEDAVAPGAKSAARDRVAAALSAPPDNGSRRFVRINSWDSGLALGDLAAVVRPGLDGILLPKADGIADVLRLGISLDAFEAAADMTGSDVRIAVVATETARAMLSLSGYAEGHSRLSALTWGAEDLGAAIGAIANRESDGGWTQPYLVARSQCLFAAAAAGANAIDTLYSDFHDLAGLEGDCARSRRDGFVGRIAIHPDQVEIINRNYTPSLGELDAARRVVETFDSNPGAGTVGIDGRMYDIPHLKAARRTLAAAGE